MLRSFAASRARRFAWGGAAGLLFAGGCLKTLDEDKIRDQPVRDGGSGRGNDGSSGRGGTEGTEGTAGTAGALGSSGSTGAGGTDGSGGSGGTGGTPAAFVPYDMARYPVTNLQGNVPAPVIIAADNTRVFRSTKNADPVALVAQDISGGTGVPIYQGLARPQRMVTTNFDYVYVVGGRTGSASAGGIWRITKIVGDARPAGEEVTTPSPIELAIGVAAASDGFAYVNAKAIPANSPTLLRFALGAGQNAEVLYRSEAGNETGGDVTANAGCVYWISNGNVWVIPTAGSATRTNALSAAINDAVGLTSDAARFYYTRSNGEVWQRQLSPSACDGSGQPEQKIAEGFGSIGDVIVWSTNVAWTAKNFTRAGADGGGVFTTPVGGGTITQIAPKEGDPEEIDQGATDVVYTTATGRIRSVPKTPR
jgi:hypothetical protein